jgi:hypothetical protein
VTWLAVAAACSRAAPPVPRADPADAAPSWAAVRPAIRCEECHGKMYAEWSASAHARAATAPLYRAMRAEPSAQRCDRCHAPLVGVVEPGDPVAREGVTCEVCHTMRDERPDRAGAGFGLALADNIERGPLCDAKDHYFHKMGCAPELARSDFCSSCHLYWQAELPVFTEFEEWKKGPYVAELECQDCHMPDETAEVAVGSTPRENVAHHGFLGKESRLRQKALAGRWSTKLDGNTVRVDVRVKNAGAGHDVPGGLPGRQVVIRVRALAGDGRELARAEHVYARVLTDDMGREVPFYRAVRLGADVRIAPKEIRTESFSLDAAGAARVRLEVVWRELSPELAKALGRPVPEDVLLTSAELAPGASGEWQP